MEARWSSASCSLISWTGPCSTERRSTNCCSSGASPCGSWGRYGYRRITAELRKRTFSVNHKTVQRLMKELGLPCQDEEVSLQTGTDRIHGLLQQPQDQGKAKGLAACNSQTASPFGCLNNFYCKILSNFGGSLHLRVRRFFARWSHRVRGSEAANKIQSAFAAACTPQKTPCAGLGPKELASADPTVDVGPECIFACYARKNARFGARALLQKRCTFFEELKTRIPRRRRRLRG